MKTKLTYVGGHKLVQCEGYDFPRNTPVEVDAEVADGILRAEAKSKTPQFVADFVPPSPVEVATEPKAAE